MHTRTPLTRPYSPHHPFLRSPNRPLSRYELTDPRAGPAVPSDTPTCDLHPVVGQNAPVADRGRGRPIARHTPCLPSSTPGPACVVHPHDTAARHHRRPQSAHIAQPQPPPARGQTPVRGLRRRGAPGPPWRGGRGVRRRAERGGERRRSDRCSRPPNGPTGCSTGRSVNRMVSSPASLNMDPLGQGGRRVVFSSPSAAPCGASSAFFGDDVYLRSFDHVRWGACRPCTRAVVKHRFRDRG